MEKKINDCYFYYNSTCNKGEDCEYRHCAEALGSSIVCTYWKKRRDCNRTKCPFRHMDSQRNRESTPCYYENQKGGCLKLHCLYKHKKPREALLKAIQQGNCKVILPEKDGVIRGNGKKTEPKPFKAKSKKFTKLPEPVFETEPSSESEEEVVKEEEDLIIQDFEKKLSLQKSGRKKKVMQEKYSQVASDRPEAQATCKRGGKQNRAATEPMPSTSRSLNTTKNHYDYNTGAVSIVTDGGRRKKKGTSKSSETIKKETNVQRPLAAANSQKLIGCPLVQAPSGYFIPALPGSGNRKFFSQGPTWLSSALKNGSSNPA